MANAPRFYARTFLSFALAILQALPVSAGTITFTRGGLNARSSNSFLGTANVLTTVPRGTEGDVQERWRLPSGNFSVKLKVTKLGAGRTSLKLDDEIWVYYHKDAERRLVEAFDDDGKKIDDMKDADAKWAVALSTFRIRNPEPAEKPKPDLSVIACTDCNSVSGVPPVVPPAQIEVIADVVKALAVEPETAAKNEDTNPVIDTNVEELVTYIKARQAKQKLRDGGESARQIAELLVKECREQNVPLDLAISIIGSETGETYSATTRTSSAGAVGPMQILPATFAGLKDGISVSAYNRFFSDRGSRL